MGPSKTPLIQPQAEVPRAGYRRNAQCSIGKWDTAGEFVPPNGRSAAQRRIASKERSSEHVGASYEFVARCLGVCSRAPPGLRGIFAKGISAARTSKNLGTSA